MLPEGFPFHQFYNFIFLDKKIHNKKLLVTHFRYTEELGYKDNTHAFLG